MSGYEEIGSSHHSPYDDYDHSCEELHVYDQCCGNCRFFSTYKGYGECLNPDLDEYDAPSAKGDDCCDLWEKQGDHR